MPHQEAESPTPQQASVSSTVNIAQYLYYRLVQLGVHALHGLPGDFNLRALDFCESCGLTWVGNCNELNAGYAADGYARVKGIGALMTTFGVGELGAINAVAGSFSEFVPVVHIVGTPSTKSQRDGMLLHHTLGNGDFHVFGQMYTPITIARTDLTDSIRAPAEIDRVLQACYVESRPVYITLPADMVTAPVDPTALSTPIDLSTPLSNPGAEARVVQLILEKIYAASNPIILVDAGADRHRVLPETESLVKKSGLQTFIAPMGKGAIDETLPNFRGLYAGSGSTPEIQNAVEASDLVLSIGNVKSDLNTLGFTYRISRLASVDLHFDNVVVDYARYEGVFMKWVIQRIVEELDVSKLSSKRKNSLKPNANGNAEVSNGNGPHNGMSVYSSQFPSTAITHEYLWPRISTWLQAGDIVVTETGTAYVGIWETRLPRGVGAISQVLWSSIGYGVGAAQGAAMAAKELGKHQRIVCFEGDGSLQCTAQELSTIIAHNLSMTLFVIENSGYTIERWVHAPGKDARYNDIPQWKYSKLPDVMTPEVPATSASTVGETNGIKKPNVRSWKISTRDELEGLLGDKEFNAGGGLKFVEMHMPREDAPKTLRDFGENAAKRNAPTDV